MNRILDEVRMNKQKWKYKNPKQENKQSKIQRKKERRKKR